MTRKSVYGGLLTVFVAVTIMTIVAISIPNWVFYSVQSRQGDHVWKKVGLHKSCANWREPRCLTYPYDEHCNKDPGERRFCDIWRSVGFAANLAIGLHLVAIVVFIVLLKGGKLRREHGYKILGSVLVALACLEYFIIGAVAYVYDHDDEFLVPGWELDTSWYLTTASASVSFLCAAALIASHYLLPPEAGYDFLHDSIEANYEGYSSD